MFDQVFENLRKATEVTLQTQQEVFKKWVGMFPGSPSFQPSWADQSIQFQKRWVETIKQVLERQHEVIETQFKLGLANLERAFAVGEAKSPEELRAKTLELWQKCFDSLRQTYEIQLREFQKATEKWLEMVTATAAV
jgi:hypothetical protein